MTDTVQRLDATIGLSQAVALYAGAVLGAGVMVLPGAAASTAGPASLLSWAVMAALSVPLALSFAQLALRRPDAGGVFAYARAAFGSRTGTAVGWFYFAAGSTGQAVVSLIGGYYVAAALHTSSALVELPVAVAILLVAVAANLRGLRFSGRVQLGLSLAVAVVLVAAAIAGIAALDARNLEPFAPHGLGAAASAAVPLFFAFAGWEAITHLSEEFRDPQRDIRRATTLTVAIVATLYLAVAFAVVAAHAYGSEAADRTAIARLLGGGLGAGAGTVAAVVAVVVSLATANVFVAATARLGYALGRDASLPTALGRLDGRRVPRVATLVVGAVAALTLVLATLAGLDSDDVVKVPSALVIATYVVGMAAAARLSAGRWRVLAIGGLVVCVALAPFAGVALLAPAALALAAALRRRPG